METDRAVVTFAATAAATATASTTTANIDSCCILQLSPAWAVTFTSMPMPKTVGRTTLYNEIVQHAVSIILLGRGKGMNITAHCP